MSAIDELANEFYRKIQIEVPFSQLKPVKRRPRYISNTKDADATKGKRFKKGATIGERKHELKLLVTNFGEKIMNQFYILTIFFRKMKIWNIITFLKFMRVNTLKFLEEVEKDKMLIKLF